MLLILLLNDELFVVLCKVHHPVISIRRNLIKKSKRTKNLHIEILPIKTCILDQVISPLNQNMHFISNLKMAINKNTPYFFMIGFYI